MKNVRRGLGKGLGTGYKNLAPMDSHIHSLSAKGISTKYNVKAVAINTETGKMIGKPRWEKINTKTNSIFKNAKNKEDVKNTYEAFWGLDPYSKEKVEVLEVKTLNAKGKTGRCIHCGMKFTAEDYKKASQGVVGDDCLVGDYDNICYPCQEKYGTKEAREKSHLDAKGKKNLYLISKAKIEKDIDKFPMFFAFSKEQLEEGLKKLKTTRKDIVSIGGGGFIKKVDTDKFKEMFKRHDKEHNEMMKNPDYVYQMFRYELSNHEYCITYDYEDTLSSLNLTMGQVNKNPLLKKQLEKATKDYMKNVGDC